MSSKLRNPLDGLIGYQLRRASASQMGSLGGKLAAIGLTPTEASLLLLIDANPGVTQSELGRVLGIQRANMAPLVALLDRKGLVGRQRVDGRSHGLAVTPSGGALGARAMEVMQRHDARMLCRLAPRRRAALTGAIARLWATEAEK